MMEYYQGKNEEYTSKLVFTSLPLLLKKRKNKEED